MLVAQIAACEVLAFGSKNGPNTGSLPRAHFAIARINSSATALNCGMRSARPLAPMTNATTFLRDAWRGSALSHQLGSARRGFGRPAETSSGGGGSPRPERFVSEDAKRAAGCEMTLDVERVVNGGVNGKEALG